MSSYDLYKIARKNNFNAIQSKNIKDALKKINAFLTNKEELVLSGIDWFNHSFKLIDNSIKVKWYFKEGDVNPPNKEISKV